MVGADRRETGEDDRDATRVRQIAHRRQIAFNLLVRLGTGGADDVVGAAQDEDDLGMEVKHVGTKAQEHLECRLAADAPVGVGLAREEAPNRGCCQKSVIESPMNTTRVPVVVRFASRYRPRFGQSRSRTSLAETRPRAAASSAQLGTTAWAGACAEAACAPARAALCPSTTDAATTMPITALELERRLKTPMKHLPRAS